MFFLRNQYIIRYILCYVFFLHCYTKFKGILFGKMNFRYLRSNAMSSRIGICKIRCNYLIFFDFKNILKMEMHYNFSISFPCTSEQCFRSNIGDGGWGCNCQGGRNNQGRGQALSVNFLVLGEGCNKLKSRVQFSLQLGREGY